MPLTGRFKAELRLFKVQGSKFNGLPSRIWLNLKLDSSVKSFAYEVKLELLSQNRYWLLHPSLKLRWANRDDIEVYDLLRDSVRR